MAEPLESTLRGPHGTNTEAELPGPGWGILDTLDEHAFVFGTNGKVLHASSHSHHLTGVQPEDLMGQRFNPPHFPRDFLLLLRLRIGEVLASRGVLEFETSIPDPGSDEGCWYLWRLHCLATPVGQVVLCYVRDVDSLHRARDMEHQLFASLSDGYVIYQAQRGDDGDITDFSYILVNPAYEAQSGIPAPMLLGRTITQVQPDAEPIWAETFARVTCSGQPSMVRHYARDSAKWFEAQAFPLGTDRCAVIYRDVSPWYLAQEEIKRDRDTIARIMELSPIGICIFDAHGHITWANPRAEAMLRETPAELLSLNIAHHGTRLVDEQGWPLSDGNSIFRRILRTHQPVYGECIHIQRQDGADGFFSISASPVLGADDRLESVVITMEDISGSKEYEAQLEKNLREKLVLIHEMNHRVKNNLAVIMAMVQLQKGRTDQSPQQIIESLEGRIYALGLLHGMLFHQDGSITDDPWCYLSQLMDYLKQSYGGHAVDISTDLNSCDGPITWEVLSASGLIINELVTNSLKYAFPSNGKHGQHIWIKLDHRNGMLCMEVRDSGTGYPPAILGLATKGGTHATVRLDSGQGKGLPLVYTLINGFGGHIQLGWGPEGGALTQVEIPVLEATS